MCKICTSKYNDLTKLLNIHCCNKTSFIPLIENNILKELVIYKNKKINTLADNLYILQKLKLYLCVVNEIPHTFKNLIEIDIIDAPELKTLPNSFIHLKKLSLKETNIEEIPKEYTHLESLILHTVPISYINDYYLLTKLHIFKTKIKKLNPNLISLKELNISKEFNIEILPITYTHLEKLYCSITRITKLPVSYTKLKLLFIHKSPISIIPKEYINIELLDCTASFVKLIPKELIKLKQLSYDDEKTVWDDSWYVEAEDRPKIIMIQQLYKNYLLYKKYKIIILLSYQIVLYKKNKSLEKINSFLYKIFMRRRLNKNNKVLVIYKLQESNYYFHYKSFKELHTIYRYVSKLKEIYIYKLGNDYNKKKIRALFLKHGLGVRYNTIHENNYIKILSVLLTNQIIFSNVILNKQKYILWNTSTNYRKEYLENYIQ